MKNVFFKNILKSDFAKFLAADINKHVGIEQIISAETYNDAEDSTNLLKLQPNNWSRNFIK